MLEAECFVINSNHSKKVIFQLRAALLIKSNLLKQKISVLLNMKPNCNSQKLPLCKTLVTYLQVKFLNLLNMSAPWRQLSFQTVFAYAQNATLIVLSKLLVYSSVLDLAKKASNHLELLTFWNIFISRVLKREHATKSKSKLKTRALNWTLTHHANTLFTICSVSREVWLTLWMS